MRTITSIKAYNTNATIFLSDESYVDINYDYGDGYYFDNDDEAEQMLKDFCADNDIEYNINELMPIWIHLQGYINNLTVCDVNSLIDFVRHNDFHYHFNGDPEWSGDYDEDAIDEIVEAIDHFDVISNPDDIETETQRLGIADDEADNYFYVRASLDANVNLVIAVNKRYE